MRKNLAYIVLVFMLPVLFSCAYFNTYYNTKKYYGEALNEHKNRKGDQPTSAEKQKFDKTIKQASKVLQLYPNSKYIDDSLMILGRSFYFLADYRKAERKFRELLELYPDSKYVPEAKLWLAKTQIQIKEYEAAENDLLKIINQKKNKSSKREAKYWLGECYRRQERYKEAAQTFSEAAKKLGDWRMKFDCYMKLGECYREIEKLPAAAESFRRASKQAKDPDLRFKADLEYGRAVMAAGDYAQAARIFSNIIEIHSENKQVGLAKLELANALMKNKKQKKALDWYNSIVEDHPRTEAAAGAYLMLGRYEEKVEHDYKAAGEYYTKATTQSAKSDYTKEAQARSNDLKTLLGLEKDITLLTGKLDKLAKSEVADSAGQAQSPAALEGADGKKTIADEPLLKSKRATPASRTGQPAKPDNPDSLKARIADKKIQLAELFLFEFDEPDSAMNHYMDILNLTSDKQVRALAFYSISYILENTMPKSSMRDSLLHILAEKYPDTPQGRQAARYLGMPVPEVHENPAVLEYEKAERVLFAEEDPHKAIQHLESVLSTNTDPDLVEKALFLMGWIYENKLLQSEKAYESYKRLVDDYAKSNYARKVRKKVLAFEKAKEEEEARQDSLDALIAVKTRGETAGVDSLTSAAAGDSLGRAAAADSVALARSEPPAPQTTLDRDTTAKAIGIPQGKPGAPTPKAKSKAMLIEERAARAEKAGKMENQEGERDVAKLLEERDQTENTKSPADKKKTTKHDSTKRKN